MHRSTLYIVTGANLRPYAEASSTEMYGLCPSAQPARRQRSQAVTNDQPSRTQSLPSNV